MLVESLPAVGFSMKECNTPEQEGVPTQRVQSTGYSGDKFPVVWSKEFDNCFEKGKYIKIKHIPVACMAEHGASNSKIISSVPNECMNW